VEGLFVYTDPCIVGVHNDETQMFAVLLLIPEPNVEDSLRGRIWSILSFGQELNILHVAD